MLGDHFGFGILNGVVIIIFWIVFAAGVVLVQALGREPLLTMHTLGTIVSHSVSHRSVCAGTAGRGGPEVLGEARRTIEFSVADEARDEVVGGVGGHFLFSAASLSFCGVAESCGRV